MVTNKKLTMGHVRPLLSLKDEDQMLDAAEYIAAHHMSVREVEQYVKTLNGQDSQPKPKKKEEEKDPLVRDIELRMSRKLGTEVKVSISIAYNDTDDLNRILEALNMLEESAE